MKGCFAAVRAATMAIALVERQFFGDRRQLLTSETGPSSRYVT
jgi:hypothetical protein